MDIYSISNEITKAFLDFPGTIREKSTDSSYIQDWTRRITLVFKNENSSILVKTNFETLNGIVIIKILTKEPGIERFKRSKYDYYSLITSPEKTLSDLFKIDMDELYREAEKEYLEAMIKQSKEENKEWIDSLSDEEKIERGLDENFLYLSFKNFVQNI